MRFLRYDGKKGSPAVEEQKKAQEETVRRKRHLSKNTNGG